MKFCCFRENIFLIYIEDFATCSDNESFVRAKRINPRLQGMRDSQILNHGLHLAMGIPSISTTKKHLSIKGSLQDRHFGQQKIRTGLPLPTLFGSTLPEIALEASFNPLAPFMSSATTFVSAYERVVCHGSKITHLSCCQRGLPTLSMRCQVKNTVDKTDYGL